MGAIVTPGDAIAEREAVLAMSRRPPRMADILAETCREFDASTYDIMGHCRRADLVRARHTAMFLCCRHSRHGVKAIGLFFGRHHSSVIHARDVIEMHVDEDRDFAARVARIEAALDLAQPQQEPRA